MRQGNTANVSVTIVDIIIIITTEFLTLRQDKNNVGNGQQINIFKFSCAIKFNVEQTELS